MPLSSRKDTLTRGIFDVSIVRWREGSPTELRIWYGTRNYLDPADVSRDLIPLLQEACDLAKEPI